jgi:DUF4097 and DUF4098 domain-containing protein YvlB
MSLLFQMREDFPLAKLEENSEQTLENMEFRVDEKGNRSNKSARTFTEIEHERNRKTESIQQKLHSMISMSEDISGKSPSIGKSFQIVQIH